MKFDPATSVQDHQYFGEFGGVNPSIEDSSTYTFLKADKMEGIGILPINIFPMRLQRLKTQNLPR